MTNREAILSVVQIKIDIDEFEIAKAAIDHDLNADDAYVKENSKSVDLVVVDLLMTLLGLSSVKEGDMTISWDTNGIKARLLFLAKKHGLHGILDLLDPQPTVEGITGW